MVISTLYILLLIALLKRPSRQQRELKLTVFIASLQKWQYDLVLSPQHFAAAKPRDGDSQFLYTLIKKSLFKAQSVEKALSAAIDLLENARYTYRMQEAFFKLIYYRCALAVGLAWVGRVCLLLTRKEGFFPQRALLWVDGACLLGSLLMTVSCIKILRTKSPSDWFWKGSFTERGKAWLTAEFLQKASPTGSFASLWQELQKKELASGLDQTHARALCLKLWLREQYRQQEIEQRIFEDFLPLFELIGLGGSAFLLIAVPSLAFFLRFLSMPF